MGGNMGGGLNIPFGEEVWPGPSNSDLVEDKNCPFFNSSIKTFNPKPFPCLRQMSRKRSPV